MSLALPILIVDDSSAFRLIVSEMLKEMGFTKLFVVTDGDEALTFLRKKRISLILSDYMMKLKNGIELLQEVKADEQLARIPFVLISAVGDQEIMDRALLLGADRCISRPLSYLQLRTEIFGVLGIPLSATEA